MICVEDGIDSSKDAGKLIISVLSAVAEIERENIRIQTMEGRIQKAREGRWNGGFVPYGYRLEKGEFVAVVGASGSGKSTLLHLLGGVEQPTEGKVFVENIDLSTLNQTSAAIFRRRKVGLIYQFYNLIPTLTVKRNIMMPMLLDKKSQLKSFLTML